MWDTNNNDILHGNEGWDKKEIWKEASLEKIRVRRKGITLDDRGYASSVATETEQGMFKCFHIITIACETYLRKGRGNK